MESRRTRLVNSKSSDLPEDYLKMVGEVFTANFDAELKSISGKGPQAEFQASGKIFADEVVVSVAVLQEGTLPATTVYASSDFDPKASSPTIQDLLAVCVDAIGAVYEQILRQAAQEKRDLLLQDSLSSLEDIPYEWTAVEVEKRTVYLKVDKANPRLDRMADDWLAKHDPDYQKHQEEEEQETEKLFVTGPKKAGSDDDNGTRH